MSSTNERVRLHLYEKTENSRHTPRTKKPSLPVGIYSRLGNSELTVKNFCYKYLTGVLYNVLLNFNL